MSAIVIIIVSLLLSAFFSGMEIAYLSSNKLKVQIENKNNAISSNLIDIFIANPGMYITTILVGNNVVMVIYGAQMSETLDTYMSVLQISVGLKAFLISVISTCIILVFAEFLPKAIFRLRSNALLRLFAVPVFLFYLLFYPVSWFSVKIGGLLIRIFTGKKLSNDGETRIFGKVDLNNLIESGDDDVENICMDNNEIKLFKNALDFSDIKLRECIVPRTNLLAVSVDDSIEELTNLFVSSGFSRILVYDDTIDNVLGYVHSSALFNNPKDVASAMSSAIVVPETMSALKLLNTFTKEHKSMAVVVDEFGVTAGIVTMEDIMEEIFGEIEDEHDHQELIEKKISDDEYILSGRLEVDYLNEKYNIGLTENEDYETLAGLILYNNESIPKEGESLLIDGKKMEILKVDNARIEEIRLLL